MSELIPIETWERLAEDPATGGTVVRRILPGLKHDVFIGETRPDGLLVLNLEVFETSAGLPRRLPTTHGLDVKLDVESPHRVGLRLMSTSSLGHPLFRELAEDVARTLSIDPGEGCAARVVERVMAWQTFFARQGDPLSKEKAAGLFSELVVLRELIVPTLGPYPGVVAWTGPDPAIQDFQHETLAVEVKSYRGVGSGRLQISSERQLELTGAAALFVAYVELDERSDGTGRTLLELVDGTRAAVSGSLAAAHQLEVKLLSYPWRDGFAEFRDERYEIRRLEYFRVEDGFPRIVSADLPSGVGAVSYIVDRSALDDFEVAADSVAEMLKGAS